jgi:hypothetical protein
MGVHVGPEGTKKGGEYEVGQVGTRVRAIERGRHRVHPGAHKLPLATSKAKLSPSGLVCAGVQLYYVCIRFF